MKQLRFNKVYAEAILAGTKTCVALKPKDLRKSGIKVGDEFMATQYCELSKKRVNIWAFKVFAIKRLKIYPIGRGEFSKPIAVIDGVETPGFPVMQRVDCWNRHFDGFILEWEDYGYEP